MKKLSALLLILALSLSLFACFGEEQNGSSTSQTQSTVSEVSTPAKKTDIKIAGLKGPTSIGLVQIMENNSNGNALNNYNFQIKGAADEVSPLLVKGELDMAAIPANLAAILYNNTQGKIKVVAINTLGVLYVVQKGDAVKSVADLKGKTIYATGKGSTPEYNLRYILTKNGIDPDKDVTIEWKSEPTEVVPLLKQSDNAIAMLPQPYVTVAQNNVEGLNIALNLNEEWEKVEKNAMMVTGVLVARTEFIENNPDAVAKMLEEYAKSAEYVNTNVEDAANLVEKFDIFQAAVAKKAIPACNIKVITGSEMKTALEGYLKVLFDANNKSVGGKLPQNDFYYGN